jgi:hypothetical protein
MKFCQQLNYRKYLFLLTKVAFKSTDADLSDVILFRSDNKIVTHFTFYLMQKQRPKRNIFATFAYLIHANFEIKQKHKFNICVKHKKIVCS